MSHKTLISGTAYEISGGKTLIGGTAYSIDKGKTLIGGTVYEVGFVEMVTVTIYNEWGNAGYSTARVTINGKIYNDYDVVDGNIVLEVPIGTEILCEIDPYSYNSNIERFSSDGNWIGYCQTDNGKYTYTVTGNVKINLDSREESTCYGTINIYEE